MPIIWPGTLALALDQNLRVRADLGAVEGEAVFGDPGLQPLQPVVHESRGIWSSIIAAGVPGRGLYLNE